MPILKRATAKLQAAGIDLQVIKCLYGYHLYNPHFRAQHGCRVYKTVDRVIQAALNGEHPIEIPPALSASLSDN